MAVKYNYVEKDDIIATQISEGKYEGIIYQVGRIQFTEPGAFGHRNMRFKYEILENKNDIEVGDDFMNIVGDIIVAQIEEKLDSGELVYANGTD